MNTFMKNIVSRGRKGLGIVAALFMAISIIGSAVAYTQDNTAGTGDHLSVAGSAGITFPIVELGNCADKIACKAYCDDGEHMGACVAFAKAHGLMNKQEADRSIKFVAAVKAGNGPGGCTSPVSCKAYCENLTHVDECVSFAEKNDLKGEEYKHSKQISAYLKQGGKTPGNCSSKQECEAYCGDFSHAEECFNFAEKAGIAQGGDQGGKKMRGKPGDKMPTSEQFKKLSELAKNGETPGGCTSKDACEAYCQVDEHFEECAAFGEKVGFINKDESEKVRKIHMEGGPGGCKSPESCRAYCDDQTHHEECFAFAEDNGLIPKEDLARMKEGLLRMREGVANASLEVQACLKTILGENVIDDLQSGKLNPAPELGEKMRECFEKFDGNHDPKDIIKKAPPEVQACLKEKLGDDLTKITTGKTEPTPEVADTFRVCFQQSQFIQQGFGGGGGGGMGSSTMNRGPGQGGEVKDREMMPKPNPDMFKNFLRSAPPEVVACIKEKLGDDAVKLESGDLLPTPELGQKLRTCFEQFRPTDKQQMMQGPGGPENMQKGMNGTQMGAPQHVQSKFPPAVVSCLKIQMNEQQLMLLSRGDQPTPEVEKLVRSCFYQVGAPQGTSPQGAQGQNGGMNMPRPQGMGPSGSGIPTEAINQMPPQVAACIKEKLAAAGGGATTREQMGPIVGMCLKEFGGAGGPPNPNQPEIQGQGMSPDGGGMMQKPPMSPPGTFNTQLMNPIPPTGTTEPKPQAANFSQNLVASAAMPFVLLWNVLH